MEKMIDLFSFQCSNCFTDHPWGTLLEPRTVNYKLTVLYIVVKDQLINHFINDLEDSFQFLQFHVFFKYCNVFNHYVFYLPAVR